MSDSPLWQMLEERAGRLSGAQQLVLTLGCLQRCYPFHERYVGEHAEWAPVTAVVDEALAVGWDICRGLAPGGRDAGRQLAAEVDAFVPADENTGMMETLPGAEGMNALLMGLPSYLSTVSVPGTTEFVRVTIGEPHGLLGSRYGQAVYEQTGERPSDQERQVSSGRLSELAVQARHLEWLERHPLTPRLVEQIRADSILAGGELLRIVDSWRPHPWSGLDTATSQTITALPGMGDAADLWERAVAGDRSAHQRLVGELAGQGHEDILRRMTDAGDHAASAALMARLAGQDRLAELRELTLAGHGRALVAWLQVLTGHGREDELRQVAMEFRQARIWLARMLADRGDVDAALAELRTLNSDRDLSDSAQAYVRYLLLHTGRVDDLRRMANAGNIAALGCLIRWLGDHDGVDELRQYAYASDEPVNRYTHFILAQLLANLGRTDEARTELRALADHHYPAARELASRIDTTHPDHDP